MVQVMVQDFTEIISRKFQCEFIEIIIKGHCETDDFSNENPIYRQNNVAQLIPFI